MTQIETLSGKGSIIQYKKEATNYDVNWGESSFSFDSSLVNYLLRNFFVNPKAYYPLGASVQPVYKDGLGEFITNLNINLTPRHASAIAAVLVNEAILKVQTIGRSIYLSQNI